ncbi:hypothetical protein MXD81_34655 [Microbacteriaceae bacterium K1510]|nr:hypothetical protein [Microbacteriaceae bacterium K1510]
MARDPPHAAGARRLDRRIKQQGDQRQFGCRVEVAKTAADGAAVARLPVTDQLQRSAKDRQSRKERLVALDVTLSGHRANPDTIRANVDAGEAEQIIDIDQRVRKDVTQVQHRHERLAARQHFRIFDASQQGHRFLEGPWAEVLEWRRLHNNRALALLQAAG